MESEEGKAWEEEKRRNMKDTRKRERAKACVGMNVLEPR